MKHTYFIILLLGVMSCSGGKTNLSFNSIDYSCYDGWTNIRSVKIDSIGQINIQGESFKKGKWFIQTEITSSILDSISKLINGIDYTNINKLYQENCMDCGYYLLIIMPPIKVFVEDSDNDNEDLMQVNKVSKYLNILIEDICSEMESVQFESKTRDFHFVAPPPR